MATSGSPVSIGAGALQRTELPYRVNPVEIYRRIVHLGDAVLLDSGDSERGRWDVLAAAPDPDAGLHLESDTSARGLRAALESLHTESEARCPSPAAQHAAGEPRPDQDDRPPFTGGYIGHFSYELGRRLQGLAYRTVTTPLASVRYYPWCIVQDRQRRRSWLLGEYDETIEGEIRRCLAPGPIVTLEDREDFALEREFSAAWSFEDFRAEFTRVRNYIDAGDCYQINIGQPFRAPFRGSLLNAYEALRAVARAPFSAYLPLGTAATLLCLSPEQFLTVNGREIETRPIKGTRPRGDTEARDRSAARALLASEKERAENLMIVDLLRNDIGRYCVPGSVNVGTLFEIESYATVHHLVSSVRGTLAPDVTPLQLLLGCLPGGSITGAPKRRAMEIIDELETEPRQAWCGTVFYLSRNGRLDSNITIRTLFDDGRELICWAGGGLVADSRAAAEFREQRDKVGAFLDRLAEPGGGVSAPAARGR